MSSATADVVLDKTEVGIDREHAQSGETQPTKRSRFRPPSPSARGARRVREQESQGRGPTTEKDVDVPDALVLEDRVSS
jgi:hypothetical protein